MAFSLLMFGFNCGFLCTTATGFKPKLILRMVVLLIFIFMMFGFRLGDQFIMLLTLSLSLFTLLVIPTLVFIWSDLSTSFIFRDFKFIFGSLVFVLNEKLEIIDAQRIMHMKNKEIFILKNSLNNCDNSKEFCSFCM